MATIVDYARAARDPFVERPLSRVDALCLAWLAYLRLPDELGVANRAGVRLADLAQDWLRARLASGLHDPERSWGLLAALGASPRFGNVRACLHACEADEASGMQFSATTFVLPDGAGSVIAFRGTDDTVLGWKENLRLACSEAIPAQRRALRYVEETMSELGGGFWICGHSKGGALAAYACGMLDAGLQAQVRMGWSFDGPGLAPELTAAGGWQTHVELHKLVPRGSLVGMLFERSQRDLAVVSSTATDVRQHDPLTWEVAGDDFALARGLDYDAWRLSQRLNDWLCAMTPAERGRFAELVGWLMDATAETTFSGLLARWCSGTQAMRAALDAAPADDRAFFARVMDDLVATVLLGSPQEHGIGIEQTPQGTADAAARRLEDATARANDHLSKLDRLTGGW